MMKRKILGLLAVALLAGPMAGQAATISVTDAFRFIRTDAYAQSGATIDGGTVTINGSGAPAGGLAAQGSFVSTREETASVATPSGTASATARTQIASDYFATTTDVLFDVAGTTVLSTATTGDGQIYSPLPNINCCRSFTLLNTFLIFDVVGGDAWWSISGAGTGFYLLNVTSNTIVTNNSFGGGILTAGSYQYQLISNVETTGTGSFDRQSVFDVNFRVTVAPVPEPGTLALLGLGLAGLGFSRRRKAA